MGYITPLDPLFRAISPVLRGHDLRWGDDDTHGISCRRGEEEEKEKRRRKEEEEKKSV